METTRFIMEDFQLKVVGILSQILADEYVLCTKTRNAHWNFEGPDFYGKHKLFEAQYVELDEIIDSLAERIRTIGPFTPATLKSYLDLSNLSEDSRNEIEKNGFIKILLSDHEQIIGYLRTNIPNLEGGLNDFGSIDLITAILKMHEKMAWMLRSHIK